MEQLLLNVINYSNYDKIVIVDGENLRGRFLSHKKIHTKKELDKYTTLNLVEAYFKYIEKYDKNTLFIFVTKNRYFYNCILEENKKYQYQNIQICYLCIKNIKAQQNEITQQKECWFKDIKDKSHIYCEYDDFMIYYLLYIMNLIRNKKIKLILYSNDKEFKNVDNVKRFKKIQYYPFHITLYNVINNRKYSIYKEELKELEFKKYLKEIIKYKNIKYTQKILKISENKRKISIKKDKRKDRKISERKDKKISERKDKKISERKDKKVDKRKDKKKDKRKYKKPKKNKRIKRNMQHKYKFKLKRKIKVYKYRKRNKK